MLNALTLHYRYLFFMAGSCGYLLIALYMVYDAEFVAPVSRWLRPVQTAFMPCVHATFIAVQHHVA